MSQEINESILYTLDRFEGKFAICENRITGEFINVPKNLIDKNAREGDILKFSNNKYLLDEISTQKAREEIKDLAKSLFKRKE